MKAFFISLLILAITSCSSRDKVPNDILPQQQLQAILWDMLRADEFVMSYIKNDSVRNKKDESTRLYEEIFRLHKTDRAQFKKSLMFYNGHPELLKVVFDSLENRKTTELDIRKRPSLTDSAHKRPIIHDSTHKRQQLIDAAHGAKPLRRDTIHGRLTKPGSLQKKLNHRDSIKRKLLVPVSTPKKTSPPKP